MRIAFACMRFLLFATLGGCALKKPLTSDLSTHLPPSSWGPFQTQVIGGLPKEDARAHSFASCGHEAGKIKLFAVDYGAKSEPKVWYDDVKWRWYARPTGALACQDGETKNSAHETCERIYGLQYYPSSPNAEKNRWRVAGTSPIIRLIPKDQYPARDAWCRFDQDTALIWVAGVGNHGLGLDWDRVDNELLASVLAWNRNRDFPLQSTTPPKANTDKLRELPAYFQLVQNDNHMLDGILAHHSEIAIKTLLANFELAYRSGIRHLEVVSHSNGTITSQLALALFTQSFNENLWKNDVWFGTPWSQGAVEAARLKRQDMILDRQKAGAPPLMTITSFHLQAAAGNTWTISTIDSFGFFSDLIPTFKWTKKKGILGNWGWEWLDPQYFEGASAYLQTKFNFYYNAPDHLTFNFYLTSVGRRVSKTWQADVVRNMQQDAKPVVTHFICKDTPQGVCGPSHSQNETLWHFSSPSMPDTQKPMAWEEYK